MAIFWEPKSAHWNWHFHIFIKIGFFFLPKNVETIAKTLYSFTSDYQFSYFVKFGHFFVSKILPIIFHQRLLSTFVQNLGSGQLVLDIFNDFGQKMLIEIVIFSNFYQIWNFLQKKNQNHCKTLYFFKSDFQFFKFCQIWHFFVSKILPIIFHQRLLSTIVQHLGSSLLVLDILNDFGQKVLYWNCHFWYFCQIWIFLLKNKFRNRRKTL